MFVRIIKQHRRFLGAATLGLVLAAAGLAPLAFARVLVNTIDPDAVVADNGRRVVVTLVRATPLDCTATEQASVRATVTQRSTGAVAEGRILVPCTDADRWAVDCPTQGEPAFEEGPATAVAFGRAIDHGQATDAHQWLVEIRLVRR